MLWSLDLIAIVVAGTMVGNEFAIAAFVHPALARLDDNAHLNGAVAIARVLGRVMPFWYGLVLALMVSDALVTHHAQGQWSSPKLAAAILWAVAIAYTVAALVPINNRVASWSQETPPTDWKVYRRQWDILHRWRVALLALSLTLFVSAALGHR